ncbi:glycosyltransferase family 2 protein [Dyadobacter sandarakinus]|uniref:Glycosyltransferase n=1 Tax=Dyadobacter sandarakinus TaxID=2747268 RepID=A0ABX7IB95_9BACT|nr:glycosyltransferase family 2 protein [Dyadobacter sandarakinus]QRR03394.1 glycosyltransferase [Dyadobacter sandarakinus]
MKDHLYPRISIITVVYNAIETLEHTIKSVLSQTYGNIEYIIIDACSTDGSSELIQSYPDRIALHIREKDNGIYDAMNKGLDHATGDWAYFLGADDLLLTPTVIEELVMYFKTPESVYYGNTYLKGSNKIYQGKINLMRFSLCNISHQAIFYPKSVFRTKRYNTRYKYFADHVYNLEIYAQDPARFVYIPVLISVYNDQGRSSTLSDDHYAEDIVAIMNRQFGPALAGYVWLRRRISGLKKSIQGES